MLQSRLVSAIAIVRVTPMMILAIAAAPLVVANLLLSVVSAVMAMIVMRFAMPAILWSAVPRSMAIIVAIACNISASRGANDRANHRSVLSVVAVANH